jgi:hypothetical protein
MLNRFVASLDGKRFLIAGMEEQAASGPITVEVNWLRK